MDEAVTTYQATPNNLNQNDNPRITELFPKKHTENSVKFCAKSCINA